MSQRLRIAIIAACPFPFPRGTPVRIYRMAEALAKLGHEVHAVTYHLGEPVEDPPFTIHRIAEVKGYTRTEAGPSWQKLTRCDPPLTKLVGKVVREQGIDLIHAHHYEGLIAAHYANKGDKQTGRKIPIVFDAHTTLASELHYYKMGLGKRLLTSIGKRIDGYFPKRASHTVSVTDNVRDLLIQNNGVKPEDITTLTNGVETDHFDIDPAEAIRDAPNGEHTLIFTGNLAGYQGVDLMLDAFGEVCQKRDDVRLKILTESPFDPYEEQAARLGVRDKITVSKSSFQDLPRHLAGSAIALNPRSECDGVPVKLLNYMAAGVPVVSCEGSAVHLTHGERGWVTKNFDAPDFAQGILHLLDHPEEAQRLGKTAQAFVQANLSWERVAERCIELYHGLLVEDQVSPAAATG